jgi:xylulokinase
MLQVDFDEFARLALAAPAGSAGLTFLPYLDGERTPNLPDARGSLHGITRENMTPENIARSAIEGMFGGLADAVQSLEAVGVSAKRVILIGGAAANPAVAAIAATMFNAPIEVPPPGEYVADGAARQAAWVLAGGEAPPVWGSLNIGETLCIDPNVVPEIQERYQSVRAQMYS